MKKQFFNFVLLSASAFLFVACTPTSNKITMTKEPEAPVVMNEDADGGIETEESIKREKEEYEKSQAMIEKEESVKTTTTPEKNANVMMGAGSYEAYDSSKIMRAKTGKVVLFFKASWCPSCQAVDADISSHLYQIPFNLSILKVDYDDSDDLKKQYGVTYQHTFVEVDENGTMIKKWSGSPTLADLVKEVQ